MFVIAAAVCDFCKKKESELYQKEVGEMTSYFNLLVFLTNRAVFIWLKIVFQEMSYFKPWLFSVNHRIALWWLFRIPDRIWNQWCLSTLNTLNTAECTF